jgi:isopenicillin N synthase-like dioxygenase
MNNGIFKSPVHRVVTNAEKERISLALTYTVERDSVLELVAGLLDEKQPARYRRITEVDFLEEAKEHFSKGMRLIETLKI